MEAMILAAGLGTRLRPWTLEHPKALVPVEGVPMLERILEMLENKGFDRAVVNVHHFASQIYDYLHARSANSCMPVSVSDETGMLLETGGGIVHALPLIDPDDDLLVHNVDILSNADLIGLMEQHRRERNDVTLLTSNRDSSRKLIFSSKGELKGWHNNKTGEYRPAGYRRKDGYREVAFSGIYVLGPKARRDMKRFATQTCREAFPVMDYFLSLPDGVRIGEFCSEGLRLLDIGKPAALERASEFLDNL